MNEYSRTYDHVLKDYLELGESSLDGYWNRDLAQRLYKLAGGGRHLWALSDQSILSQLSDRQVMLLLRAATVISVTACERNGGIGFGSTSPVFKFFFELASRTREYEPALTEWILAVSQNHYDPMGCADSSRRARDFLEYGVCSHDAYVERYHNHRDEEYERIKCENRKAKAVRSLIRCVSHGDLSGVKYHIDSGLVDPFAVQTEFGSLLDLALSSSRESVSDYLKSIGLKRADNFVQ